MTSIDLAPERAARATSAPHDAEVLHFPEYDGGGSASPDAPAQISTGPTARHEPVAPAAPLSWWERWWARWKIARQKRKLEKKRESDEDHAETLRLRERRRQLHHSALDDKVATATKEHDASVALAKLQLQRDIEKENHKKEKRDIKAKDADHIVFPWRIGSAFVIDAVCITGGGYASFLLTQRSSPNDHQLILLTGVAVVVSAVLEIARPICALALQTEPGFIKRAVALAALSGTAGVTFISAVQLFSCVLTGRLEDVYSKEAALRAAQDRVVAVVAKQETLKADIASLETQITADQKNIQTIIPGIVGLGKKKIDRSDRYARESSRDIKQLKVKLDADRDQLDGLDASKAQAAEEVTAAENNVKAARLLSSVHVTHGAIFGHSPADVTDEQAGRTLQICAGLLAGLAALIGSAVASLSVRRIKKTPEAPTHVPLHVPLEAAMPLAQVISDALPFAQKEKAEGKATKAPKILATPGVLGTGAKRGRPSKSTSDRGAP